MVVAIGRFRPILLCFGIFSFCLLATAPTAGAAPKGFKFGVSSGDVSSGAAILWARANKAGTALVQLQKGGKFGPCDIGRAPKKLKAKAAKGDDFTVQARVTGLKPGRRYKYRWCMTGGRRSAVGIGSSRWASHYLRRGPMSLFQAR